MSSRATDSAGRESPTYLVGPYDNWLWPGVAVPSAQAGPAVIFDMDGVLSDASGRQHLLERPFPAWDAFFSACGQDGLIESTAELVGLLDPELTIVLLTARPGRVQRQTVEWLEKHGFRWDLLIMRDFGDYSASQEFKRWSLAQLRHFGFEPKLAFEDDPRNAAMFDAEGVPCVYIHSGYYE